MLIKNPDYDIFYDIMDKGSGTLNKVNFNISFKDKDYLKVHENLEEKSRIFQISNASITFLDNPSEKVKKIPGNIFLIDLDFLDSHYHFLVDFIGQYFLIKKYVKDLVPVLISYQHGKEKIKLEKHLPLSKYFYSVLNKLDIFEDSVIDLREYKSLVLKNIFITDPFFNGYLQGDVVNTSFPGNTVYGLPEVANLLRVNTNYNNNNKVFVSRIKENDIARKLLKDLENQEKVIHGRRVGACKKTLENFNATEGYGQMIKIRHRLMSLEDEKSLENFFRLKGYRIVDPSQYTLDEQLDIFSNATHVAGLSGAGLINSIFSNHKVKLFILNPSSGYGFDHGEGPKVVGHSVVYIPEISGKGQDITRLSVDEIIERLQLESL
jgi:hypothetical protein